ncbi:hypothetical protein NDU88_006275 [Pleurodeles waltl]|uniref:Uncharacterized protein n=1 Tax=Pleurodeles waltl TaxID=8319 RepID=A0AAV7LUF5_PLEWA|nr:hypothetical protein NDU88_006275 [Pleurodeles waltl]
MKDSSAVKGRATVEKKQSASFGGRLELIERKGEGKTGGVHIVFTHTAFPFQHMLRKRKRGNKEETQHNAV